jgi:DNA-binding PadR family transcriptional regulator
VKRQNILNVRALLLEELRAGGEGWGMDLIDRVAIRSEDGFRLSVGAVYPTLYALVAEGLVSEDRDPRRMRAARGGGAGRGGAVIGRPVAAVYALTAAGRREAERLRAAVLAMYGGVGEDAAPGRRRAASGR